MTYATNQVSPIYQPGITRWKMSGRWPVAAQLSKMALRWFRFKWSWRGVDRQSVSS